MNNMIVKRQITMRQVLDFLLEEGIKTRSGETIKLTDVQGYCRRNRFPDHFPYDLYLDRSIENEKVKLYNITKKQF